MTHTITVRISSEKGIEATFECYEPQDAWCRQNAVDGSGCWFTNMASGQVTWSRATYEVDNELRSGEGGIYRGSPTELRSGEIEFGRGYQPATVFLDAKDYCSWRYRDTDAVREATP